MKKTILLLTIIIGIITIRSLDLFTIYLDRKNPKMKYEETKISEVVVANGYILIVNQFLS